MGRRQVGAGSEPPSRRQAASVRPCPPFGSSGLGPGLVSGRVPQLPCPFPAVLPVVVHPHDRAPHHRRDHDCVEGPRHAPRGAERGVSLVRGGEDGVAVTDRRGVDRSGAGAAVGELPPAVAGGRRPRVAAALDALPHVGERRGLPGDHRGQDVAAEHPEKIIENEGKADDHRPLSAGRPFQRSLRLRVRRTRRPGATGISVPRAHPVRSPLRRRGALGCSYRHRCVRRWFRRKDIRPNARAGRLHRASPADAQHRRPVRPVS